MSELEIHPEIESINRKIYVADRPIDFDTWIELAQTWDTELHRGVMVDKMAAQYPHEWIFAWLMQTLGVYVLHRKLGQVLGSRSAVRITANDGRLPDLLFVRADNLGIIQTNAIHGTPDLVVEIVSANDRPSDLIPLEADYRSIGVGEIVFIDTRKKRVRHLQKNADGDYDEATLTTGLWQSAVVPGFAVEVEWLFADEKPDALTVVLNLLKGGE